jgi:hypothetical protein
LRSHRNDHTPSIAERVLDAARAGERDPIRLLAAALAEIAPRRRIVIKGPDDDQSWQDRLEAGDVLVVGKLDRLGPDVIERGDDCRSFGSARRQRALPAV